MSLAPYYVLWAVTFFTIALINGGIAWLFIHRAMIRLLRRLWLSDLVLIWLGYAAVYHLIFLDVYRSVLGEPYALWTLCGLIGLYLALRRAPTPLRRPERMFVLVIMIWALAIAAGYRFIDESDADAALLAERPKSVLQFPPAGPAMLSPLRRALLLSRLDAQSREETVRVLIALSASPPADAPEQALLSAYRINTVPVLLELYERDLTRLRTYQWIQIALLAAVLLVWVYGRVPDWESL